MIDISLIGTGGMMILPERFLTAMALRYNGSIILTDCGESTQVTLKLLGWGFKNIDYICCTHFHADHMAGLPCLLLTIGNSGRTEPLTIIGSVGINDVVNSLRVIAPVLSYEIKFIEISSAESVNNMKLENGIELSSLQLSHGMPCLGYSFKLFRAGKFDVRKALLNNIPKKFWKVLQKGETVKYEDKIFTPDIVLGEERKGLKISYITDTLPTDNIPKFIDGSDLFICEGLYGDNEKELNAGKHMHMIFSQAARLAKLGNVKELWLTHYSPAIGDPQEYIENAAEIFKNTTAGYDRLTKTLNFDDKV